MTELDERVTQQEAPRFNPRPDPEGWVLQINFKTQRGALINIRGFNPFDLAANLEAVRGMADQILEAEAELFGQSNVQAIPPALHALGAQPVAPSFGQPQQQNWQPQQQGAPMCQHGEPAKYVQGGMSRTGRPYKAFWACARDRANQCNFRADA